MNSTAHQTNGCLPQVNGTHTNGSSGLNGSLQDPALDGYDDDPIAVCGFAIKFPEDATTPDKLWQMLLEKRCVSGEFPPERCNPEGFYQKNSNRLNTVRASLFIFGDIHRPDTIVYRSPLKVAITSRKSCRGSMPTSSPFHQQRQHLWTPFNDGLWK